MQPGMAFTIEPVIMLERPTKYWQWDDKWTVLSDVPSVQWEHTVLITEDGYEVLTRREGEVI